MDLRQWWPLARRISAVVFFLLFLLIPVGLLASIEPCVFAVIAGACGAVSLLASPFLSARARSKSQNAAKALLTVAVILAIVHFSGLLRPFYTREGWLLLELDVRGDARYQLERRGQAGDFPLEIGKSPEDVGDDFRHFPKTQFTVLKGLLRLFSLCDDPGDSQDRRSPVFGDGGFRLNLKGLHHTFFVYNIHFQRTVDNAA